MFRLRCARSTAPILQPTALWSHPTPRRPQSAIPSSSLSGIIGAPETVGVSHPGPFGIVSPLSPLLSEPKPRQNASHHSRYRRHSSSDTTGAAVPALHYYLFSTLQYYYSCSSAQPLLCFCPCPPFPAHTPRAPPPRNLATEHALMPVATALLCPDVPSN